MKKYILFKGEIETLEYFSLELAKTFTEHGISVFMFDLLEEEESFEQLKEFCKGSSPIMITFNFTGIRGDDIFYDENGNPIKHIPRHPILEDGVIVYSNATILGRVTIGENAVIGANVWITQDVPASVKVTYSKSHS